MARQTSHPQKRARREAALARRTKELSRWNDGYFPARYVEFQTLREDQIAKHIARAEEDIANLKAKLGPVYAEVSE
jgi:hypothetical protein